MAIKKYIADKDNTITNAHGTDLRTRASGSNMGAADILEVFSIYGQQTTSSIELSRALVQFPVSNISADRTSGAIPASGSVRFFLRLFNARHSEQLPENFTVNVLAVSSSWQEGSGLDMESYTDKTKDKIEGSNWMNASSNITAATATLTALSKTAGQANTRRILIEDIAGNSVNFLIDNGITTSTATNIAFGNANSNANQFATNIAAAINLAKAASTLNVTASASTATVTLEQTTKGLAGNKVADISGTGVSDSVVTVNSQFSGGDGHWVDVGGDYHSSAYTPSQTMPNYNFTFNNGAEDLLVDVTMAVEEWIKNTQPNYGFGVFLTSSFEGSSSFAGGSNDGPVLHNPDGTTKSFYTKRFFSRSSEFFFKKPCIEARWDSRISDDRNNFYYSSSLAPAADNLNTIYLYNYVRGQLTNIPKVGTGEILVSIYSGSSDDTAPTEGKLKLSKGGGVATDGHLNVTGGYVSTGIYSASFAFTGSGNLKTIYDVWHAGTTTLTTGAKIEYATGSIRPKTLSAPSWNQYNQYVSKITNLKSTYTTSEQARFRVFTRPRNFTPTIYSVASTEMENTIIPSASYEIIRMVDERTVINNSTGSSTNHTYLSYDKSGSYFDLDMTLLEPGYMYGVKLSYYSSGQWREQEEVFKFRVENN